MTRCIFFSCYYFLVLLREIITACENIYGISDYEFEFLDALDPFFWYNFVYTLLQSKIGVRKIFRGMNRDGGTLSVRNLCALFFILTKC